MTFGGRLHCQSHHWSAYPVGTSEFPKDGTEEPRGAWFRRSTPPGRDIESLDALARTWLTVSLLDMGLKEFEPWLETLPVLCWMPQAST